MSRLLTDIYEILPTLAGWCSKEKVKVLTDLILTNQPDVCVEIGVFGGSSLIPQALALKHNGHGIIFGVDPWDAVAAIEGMTDEANRKWWGHDVNLPDIRKRCQDAIDSLNLRDCCKLVPGKSEDAAYLWENETIDLLHIDGNKSEEVSFKDVELYLPKVKDGGYIIFEDFLWSEGGKNTTKKALAYLLEHCKHIDVIKNCAVLQKTTEAKMKFDDPYDIVQYGKKLDFHPVLEGEEDSTKIVPVIFNKWHPQSVIDFGCNAGHWLKQFMNLGVSDVLGIDGENMLSQLLIPVSNFVIYDLKQPLDVHRKFDLAICTETAEHLPRVSADVIVDSICNHSDLVVFSSAHPDQGGYCHLNEQPMQYWIDKFAAKGYSADRTLIQDLPGVSSWFVENLIVFKKE